MTEKRLKETKKEVKRFLTKVEELEYRLEQDEYAFYGCKETGSVKRSSMDLSRSLSELRKFE